MSELEMLRYILMGCSIVSLLAGLGVIILPRLEDAGIISQPRRCHQCLETLRWFHLRAWGARYPFHLRCASKFQVVRHSAQSQPKGTFEEPTRLGPKPRVETVILPREEASAKKAHVPRPADAVSAPIIKPVDGTNPFD